MNNGEGQAKSWWTTLPVLITALASFITAIVGLLAVLKGWLPQREPYASTPRLQRTSESSAYAAQRHGFRMINVSAILNERIENVVDPGFWQVRTGFKSIPFVLSREGQAGAFETQNQGRPDRPTKATLNINPQRVKTVYMLITGTYVLEEFRDREVGCIVLRFSNGCELKLPLIALQHLRENWAFKDSPQQMNASSIELLHWDNVYKEDQQRGSSAAEAYIDMLTLTVPEPFSTYELTNIEFVDESVELVHSTNPALDVCAVTVEV